MRHTVKRVGVGCWKQFTSHKVHKEMMSVFFYRINWLILAQINDISPIRNHKEVYKNVSDELKYYSLSCFFFLPSPTSTTWYSSCFFFAVSILLNGWMDATTTNNNQQPTLNTWNTTCKLVLLPDWLWIFLSHSLTHSFFTFTHGDIVFVFCFALNFLSLCAACTIDCDVLCTLTPYTTWFVKWCIVQSISI